MEAKLILGKHVKIKGGKRIPKGYSITEEITANPYLRVTDLTSGRVSLSEIKYVPNNVAKFINRYRIFQEEAYISIAGTVGLVGKIPFEINGCLLTENCAKFTSFSDVLDRDFLIYYLRSPEGQHQIWARTGGATQPKLALTRIASIELPFFLKNAQSRIASMLSTYDDLIENNLKRIKLFEELAQLTFNKSFTNKKGLPKGWKEKNLGSLVGHEIGGGWGEEVQNREFSEAAFVIRGTDIDELPNGKLENVPFRFHKKSNLVSRKLQAGDIVFEVSGGSNFEGVAKTLLITDELLKQFNGDVMCASFCKLLRPASKEISNFTFLFLRFLRAIGGTEVFEIRSASSIVNYNWTAFLKFQKVKVPDDKTLKQFNEVIDPIYKQIYNLGHQNRLLKEARDILLPRLMTGMIAV